MIDSDRFLTKEKNMEEEKPKEVTSCLAAWFQ